MASLQSHSQCRITISGSGLNKYPAKQHAEAVVKYLDVSEGLIYLCGQHTELFEDSDQNYAFRQRRYLYYLSGVDEPDCYLTYDVKRNHLTLYIVPISVHQVIWFGRGSTPKQALDKYDVDDVRLVTTLEKDVLDWVCRNPRKTVYALHKDQIPPSLNPRSRNLFLDTESLIKALNASRTIKSPHEIALIRHAINLSSTAHRNILHHISSLQTEAEIHALYVDISIAHGALHQSYSPIVASGSNAAILHYSANNASLTGKGLVCMDAGCEWECYASDITRTFPTRAQGWATRETAEIYAIVEEMQEECIRRLKPGVRYLDLHVLAHRIAIKGLTRLGIFKPGNVEEVMREGINRAFFPHGLGHHMGLEVHDVSSASLMSATTTDQGKVLHECATADANDFPILQTNSSYRPPCTISSPPLAENMILTVEPGIYFSRYALEAVYLPDPKWAKFVDREVLERYMHVGGVRIEDDVLITRHGYENLTTAPKGAEMLRLVKEGAACGHGRACGFKELRR